jgi:hypothetical protein
MLPDPRTGDTSCLRDNAFAQVRVLSRRPLPPEGLDVPVNEYFPREAWPPSGNAACVQTDRDECVGGDERTRTADPLLAKQVLYQLSYVPSLTCGNSVADDARRVADSTGIAYGEGDSDSDSLGLGDGGGGDIPGLHCFTGSRLGARSWQVRRHRSLVYTVSTHHR